MRLTEFWHRLDTHLGADYARSWASMQVLSALDGRTVDEALADGVDAKQVWRAVHSYLGLPARER